MSTNLLQNTESQIKEILEREVKPLVALHRGSIEFVSFQNGVVNVRLEGTCKGCPLSQLTLKAGVESLLKDKIPSIDSVEAVV
ncbi:MAG: NifU family protein [Candidatus Ryanbacteria bacterium]|nr:NifU family protein [Candidatus Ryanbacteria bacterium]